jgi:hypothetical protein
MPNTVSQTDEVVTVVTNGVDTHGFDACSSPRMTISSTIEGLQTNGQHRVLDTVSQARKCGLKRIRSTPQIIARDEQLARKIPVLEALIGIPFFSQRQPLHSLRDRILHLNLLQILQVLMLLPPTPAPPPAPAPASGTALKKRNAYFRHCGHCGQY